MRKIAEKIKLTKPGTKQPWFSLRLIIFDPSKHFVGTDEAKEYWRKANKIGKDKMKNEFCSIFANYISVGKGRKKHLEFNKSLKTEANCIFVVPTKYRKEAYEAIKNLEF